MSSVMPATLSSEGILRPLSSGSDESPMSIGQTAASSVVRIINNGTVKRSAPSDDEGSSSRGSDGGAAEDAGLKDEEEEAEDEDPRDDDPERLKAFNLFVRLFVDENLDRSIPISKQPKEKIQAIIDACSRQFPEFQERSRKRIRTYLKSCRRLKRPKTDNEPTRSTAAQLSSPAAENVLALACENESVNAQRMRAGLEPLPASEMSSKKEQSSGSQGDSKTASEGHTHRHPGVATPPTRPQETITSNQANLINSMNSFRPSVPISGLGAGVERSVTSKEMELHRQGVAAAAAAAFRTPHDFSSLFPGPAAAAAMFRAQGIAPGFPMSPLVQSSMTAHLGQTDATDLTVKKPRLSASNNNGETEGKRKLSFSEVSTIKQLIMGYRESAAFLQRSADELEALLPRKTNGN